MPVYHSAKITFLDITFDYRRCSINQNFKLQDAVHYFYVSTFQDETYVFVYRLVRHIEVYHLEFLNIEIVIIAQILCNFFREVDAPFKPSQKSFDFTDVRGTYHNKYETHDTTLNSIKKLDPTLPEDFEFTDYMKIDFNFEEHPHLFLRALREIGYHNPKFDIASPNSPFAGIFFGHFYRVSIRILNNTTICSRVYHNFSHNSENSHSSAKHCYCAFLN